MQRLDEVSDTWIIRRPSNDAAFSFSSDNDNNNIVANDKNALTNNLYNGESVQQLVGSTFNIVIVGDNSAILDFYKDLFLFSIDSKNDGEYAIEAFSSVAEAL